MPTLAEATRPLDPTKYAVDEPESPATNLTPPPFTNQDTLYSIRSNVNLRCPTPPINVSPDNLRQYYRGGQAPQYRVLSPPTLSSQASAGGSTNTTVTVASSSSSTTPVAPTAQSTALTTPALIVGQVYTTVMQIAKGFQCFRVTVSAPARVELYKTAAGQAADLSRTFDQPIVLGTENDIICDMYLLQASELDWVCSPDFPGSNGDSPQTSSIYTTVTNIGSSAAAIVVTINFVQTVS